MIDDDKFFTQRIFYHCELHDWYCVVKNELSLKFISEINESYHYILLDASLLNIFSFEQKEKILQEIKNKGQGNIILCSEYPLDDELQTLKQLSLVKEVTKKPFDLRQLEHPSEETLQSEEQNNLKINSPYDFNGWGKIITQATYELPVAIALFKLNSNYDELLWKNKKWDSLELSQHDKRLLRLTLYDIRQELKQSNQVSPKELHFPSTDGKNIAVWSFLVSNQIVYFARHYKILDPRNDDFSYLDALRDPVGRFLKVRELLAQRYAISRLRIYEVDLLPDSFNSSAKDGYLPCPLMIPRFISGGGTVDRITTDPSTQTWFDDEFVRQPLMEQDSYRWIEAGWIGLGEVADADDPQLQNNTTQGCNSLSWGDAGTCAQVMVKDAEGSEKGHLAFDQRLDHLRTDTKAGQIRKELEWVLRGEPFADAQSKIGVPPLTESEVKNMIPVLKILCPAIVRWFKRRQDQAEQVWDLILTRLMRCILSSSNMTPPLALKYLFEAMATAWPLIQGLRLPAKAVLEHIIDERFDNQQRWEEMLKQLGSLAEGDLGELHSLQEREEVPLDKYLQYHLANQGLTNLYIAQQTEEGFFRSLGGYGRLVNQLRRFQPWPILEPHRKAFINLNNFTVIQDFQDWRTYYVEEPLYQAEAWQAELASIGSWCALSIPVKSRQHYPTLLIVTSQHKNYFSESRVSLLESLAGRLLPFMRWYEEWAQSDKIRRSVAHGLGHHIADFRAMVRQNNWQGVEAMLPLLQGFHGNFSHHLQTKKSASTLNSKTTFGIVLEKLRVLKHHPDYEEVMQDWEQWELFSSFELAVDAAPLQQILYNFLSNARIYAENNSVHLAAETTTGFLTLFIFNQCKTPLTEHDRRYLFISGYRPDNAIGSGSGSGLAVAKELADIQGIQLNLCDPDCIYLKKYFTNLSWEYQFGQQITIPIFHVGEETYGK